MNELPLRDIHLPEPISWWPLALGWWLILAALVGFTLFACWYIKKRKTPTLKKEAIKELERIECLLHMKEDPACCLAELSVFLRRVILSQKSDTPRRASLTGDAYLRLLDKPLGTAEFSQGAGRILLAGPYQAEADYEAVLELVELCKRWVNSL